MDINVLILCMNFNDIKIWEYWLNFFKVTINEFVVFGSMLN